MRKAIIQTVAPATLASALLVLASGWESTEGRDFKPGPCTDRHGACVDRCLISRYPMPKYTGEQGSACIRRTCDRQYDNCVKTQGNRPQSSGGVKDTGGGVAKDPKSPPKSTGTRPPVDNKWHGPTSPPKGGTWHGSSPGGSGPILKSGGKR